MREFTPLWQDPEIRERQGAGTPSTIPVSSKTAAGCRARGRSSLTPSWQGMPGAWLQPSPAGQPGPAQSGPTRKQGNRSGNSSAPCRSLERRGFHWEQSQFLVHYLWSSGIGVRDSKHNTQHKTCLKTFPHHGYSQHFHGNGVSVTLRVLCWHCLWDKAD